MYADHVKNEASTKTRSLEVKGRRICLPSTVDSRSSETWQSEMVVKQPSDIHNFLNSSSRQVVFKQDTFKLEGNQVTLNGEAVIVPLHKTYGDGSVLSMSDVGKSTDQSEEDYT